VILKGDGKVAPVQAMKAFERSDGIAHLILNLGTSDHLHAPVSLSQGKNPWHTLNGRPPQLV